jgi:hypothetical protein
MPHYYLRGIGLKISPDLLYEAGAYLLTTTRKNYFQAGAYLPNDAAAVFAFA